MLMLLSLSNYSILPWAPVYCQNVTNNWETCSLFSINITLDGKSALAVAEDTNTIIRQLLSLGEKEYFIVPDLHVQSKLIQ